MAMSMGQHKSDGHSSGSLGHGGEHRVGGHGSSSSPRGGMVHVNDPGGHTSSMQSGGSLNVGCC